MNGKTQQSPKKVQKQVSQYSIDIEEDQVQKIETEPSKDIEELLLSPKSIGDKSKDNYKSNDNLKSGYQSRRSQASRQLSLNQLQLKKVQIREIEQSDEEDDKIVKIHESMKEFEEKYSMAKLEMNELDKSLMVDSIIQNSIETCMQIIKDSANIWQINQNTTEKEKIMQMDKTVQEGTTIMEATVSDFSTYRGKFIAIHDRLTNKNLLTLKLPIINSIVEKQEELVDEQFPKIDQAVKNCLFKMDVEKNEYLDFITAVMKILMTEIENIVKLWESKYDKISQQISSMKEDLDTFQKSIKDFRTNKPTEQDQLDKIKREINQASILVDKAETELQKRLKAKKQLVNIYADLVKQEFNKKGNFKRKILIPRAQQVANLIKHKKDMQDEYERLEEFDKKTISQIVQELDSLRKREDELLEKMADGIKGEMLVKIDTIKQQGIDLDDLIEKTQKRIDDLREIAKDPNIEPEDAADVTDELDIQQSILETVKAAKQALLDRADKVNSTLDTKKKPNDLVDDLDNIDDVRTKLDYLKQVDLKDINHVLDELEMRLQKQKTKKLFDQAKKIEDIIGSCKEDFGDLTKEIEKLNKKINEVNAHGVRQQQKISSPDQDIDNKIKSEIMDPLQNINLQVNGENLEDPSLKDIRAQLLKDINNLVENTNNNNREMTDAKNNNDGEKLKQIMEKTKDLVDTAQKLQNQIKDAKDQAGVLDKKLDELLIDIIPKLDDEIEKKYALIAKADDLIQNLTDDLDKEINYANKMLTDLDELIEILEESLENETDPEAKKDIQKNLDEALKLKDAIQKKKEQLENDKAHLQKIGDELDNLDKKDIPIEKVQEMMENLKDIKDRIDGLHGGLGMDGDEEGDGESKGQGGQKKKKMLGEMDFDELKQKVDDLKRNADDHLKNNQEKYLTTAKAMIKQDQIALNDINDIINENKGRLEDIKAQIQQLRETCNPDDPEVQQKLKELEDEANDIDKLNKEHQKKADELKDRIQQVKQAIAEQEQLKPGEKPKIDLKKLVDGINNEIYDTNKFGKEVLDKEDELDKKLQDFKNKMAEVNNLRAMRDQVQSKIGYLEDAERGLNETLGTVPQNGYDLVNSFKEMLKDSGPDKAADYFEEKGKIEENYNKILANKAVYDKAIPTIAKYRARIEEYKKKVQTADQATLEKMKDTIEKECQEIEELCSKVFDCSNVDRDIHEKTGDFWIPMNITHREDEIENLDGKLEGLRATLEDLQKGDDEFDGNKESEKKIADQRKKAEECFNQLKKESDGHSKYLQNPIKKYQIEHMKDTKLNVEIIKNMREFRLRIKASFEKLADVKKEMDELSNLIIMQDIGNGTKTLGKLVSDLKQRIEKTKELCGKIVKCGRELDGNTTNDEEKDYVEAISDEMPEILKQLGKDFENVDKILAELEKVKKSQNPNDLRKARESFNVLSESVDNHENMANALEAEIIEWDAQKKLCKRDYELDQILNNQEQVIGVASDEIKDVNEDLKTLAENLKQKPNDQKNQEDQQALLEYVEELTNFISEIEEKKKTRNELFKAFDAEVPNFVRANRNQRRNQGNNQKRESKTQQQLSYMLERIKDTEVAMSFYDQISINCKYRPKIKSYLKESIELWDLFDEIRLKYTEIRKNITVVKHVKIVYKFTAGDEVDKLFGEALIRRGCTVKTKRISAGIYMFGTRQIIAKIVNNKLLIRVGGGFMSIDEFITQYGPIEMIKYNQAQQVDQGFPRSKSTTSPSKSMAKEVSKMRATIASGLAENAQTSMDSRFSTGSVEKGGDGYSVSKVSGFEGLKNLETELIKKSKKDGSGINGSYTTAGFNTRNYSTKNLNRSGTSSSAKKSPQHRSNKSSSKF